MEDGEEMGRKTWPFARPRGLIEVWKKAGFLGSRDRNDDLKVTVGGDGCGEYDGCG